MSFSQQQLSSQELLKKAEREIEEPGYVQNLEGLSEMDKTRILARVNQIRTQRERASRRTGGKKRLTKKGRKARKGKGTKKMRKSKKNRKSRRSRK